MMYLRNITLLGLSILLINACTNKVDGVKVHEDLVPFYELFEEEAAKRGVDFDNAVEKIEGSFQNIPTGGVIGACKRNADNENDPEIFFDVPYWETATQLEREYVFFHELGHCFLGLSHDDTADEKGDCISIMASGVGDCRDNYNNTTRDALLDELFAK